MQNCASIQKRKQNLERFLGNSWVYVYKYNKDNDKNVTKIISNEDYKDRETIYVSQDFNYLGSISIVYVKRNGFDVAIDEIISNDTKSIIANIKKLTEKF